jgi:hypothetical protein
VEALHAPWLVVLGRDGRAIGAMPTDSLRKLMEVEPHGTLGEMPFKGAMVLPRTSRLSEVLRALKSPEIDAVVLVEGSSFRRSSPVSPPAEASPFFTSERGCEIEMKRGPACCVSPMI